MSVIEIARGDEGALYACGGNDSGQICLEGIGESRELRFVAPSVVGPAVYVAAGCSHTYVISSSTAVFGCGANDRGQLAVAETEDSALLRPRWLQCIGFNRINIIQVACGEGHSMALGADGEVFAWGAGDGGRLGLGDVRSRATPQQLAFFRGRSSRADDNDGNPGTVGSISCGYHHSMAVTVDGIAYAWGSGLSGQLGNGTQESRLLPTRMLIEGHRPFKAFAARGGEYHSAVLSDTGYLYTCGANGCGQLGLEHEQMVFYLTPVKALYGLKIRLVSCGSSFTVAATDNAQIFAWGDNRHGQLGLGDTLQRSKPTNAVTMNGVSVTALCCGGQHVIAVQSNGCVWSWGRNDFGQLGHGDTNTRTIPVDIRNSDVLGITRVACGFSHTFLLSGLDPCEAQARRWHESGKIHVQEVLYDNFYFFRPTSDNSYKSMSEMKKFFTKHNRPIISRPCITVCVARDDRLHRILSLCEQFAVNTPEFLSRFRVVAMCIFYEFGGLISSLPAICASHIDQVLSRPEFANYLIPIGCIRIGDAQIRALALKFVCDKLGIPCCVVRGRTPTQQDDETGALACRGSDWKIESHVWVCTKDEEGVWYYGDVVSIPTRLSRVSNQQEFIAQIGRAHFIHSPN